MITFVIPLWPWISCTPSTVVEYNKWEHEGIKINLAVTDWVTICAPSADVAQMYNYFLDYMHFFVNKFLPLKVGEKTGLLNFDILRVARQILK